MHVFTNIHLILRKTFIFHYMYQESADQETYFLMYVFFLQDLDTAVVLAMAGLLSWAVAVAAMG